VRVNTEAVADLTARWLGQGVSVTALCPGPVKSGFQDASGAHDFASGLPKPLCFSPRPVVMRVMDST
jgi:short-subunit dehydrogenase